MNYLTREEEERREQNMWPSVTTAPTYVREHVQRATAERSVNITTKYKQEEFKSRTPRKIEAYLVAMDSTRSKPLRLA